MALPLTITSGGNITEAAGAANGISQTSPTTITLATAGSVSLNNPNNNWLGLIDLSTGANGLTLTNSGTRPANAASIPINTGNIAFLKAISHVGVGVSMKNFGIVRILFAVFRGWDRAAAAAWCTG